MSLSTTFVLSTSIVDDIDVASKEGEDANVTLTSTNETSYSNSSSNGTAYQCQGPTKDEMKLYEILAWWMDAICQVIRIRGVVFE